LLDKNCYFNKGFLLKLSQLYFKQSSAEDAYDLFPPEGYGIERGRKLTCPWMKTDTIPAGRGQKRI
jgi:hypothetical protein